MHGFFSLEEYHARDLEGYYRALIVHPHHNYYEGRATADLTSWLEYFIGLLASVFQVAKEEALTMKATPPNQESDLLRGFDHRARMVLGLFARQDMITVPQVAAVLGLSDRMVRNLMKDWAGQGWLVVANHSAENEPIRYRQSIGKLLEDYRHYFRIIMSYKE